LPVNVPAIDGGRTEAGIYRAIETKIYEGRIKGRDNKFAIAGFNIAIPLFVLLLLPPALYWIPTSCYSWNMRVEKPKIYLETTMFNFPFADDAPQYRADAPGEVIHEDD
jgi:hypothetical protein